MASITQHSGGSFVELPSQQDVDDFTKRSGKYSSMFSAKQKEQLLHSFRFLQDLYTFSLEQDASFNESGKSLVLLTNIMFFHLYRGLSIPLEFYYRAHLKKFGMTSANVEQLQTRFGHMNDPAGRLPKAHKEVIDKLQGEIDRAREAQMSAMYC